MNSVRPFLIGLVGMACLIATGFAAARPSGETVPCGYDWLRGFAQPGVDGPVNCAAMFDDGRGPALFIGGSFKTAGNVSARGIARWDGAQWTEVGGGVSGASSRVLALAVHDDGAGPALFAAGDFSVAGGALANNIARWNGTSWEPLGSGVSNTVHALHVFDDGTGPSLYVGGRFKYAGSERVDCVARWNGSSWSALGQGIGSFDRHVSTFTVGEWNGKPTLFIGGRFTTAGSVNTRCVARWNGTSWGGMAGGLGVGDYGDIVRDLTYFDPDGPGGAPGSLIATGEFRIGAFVNSHHIARWNGTAWTALGGELNERGGHALLVIESGAAIAPGLYVAGDFTMAGGVPCRDLARWDGTAWSAVPIIQPEWHSTIHALCLSALRGETALIVGGEIPTPQWRHVLSYDGSNAMALGSSRAAPHDPWCIGVESDEPGAAIFAGGWVFSNDDSIASVMQLGPSGWRAPAPLKGYTADLKWFDDGHGRSLFASGELFTDDGVPRPVVRLQGDRWLPVGELYGLQARMAVYDDGTGPALYAGGQLGLDESLLSNGVFKWNGTAWSPIAINTSGPINALVVYDDGSGPMLYVGGRFDSIGGVQSPCIARWNGMKWLDVGGGLQTPTWLTGGLGVWAMAVHDAGDGSQLYVGGQFNVAGSVPVDNIARWNGEDWFALGDGLRYSMGNTDFPVVHTLHSLTSTEPPTLIAAGAFDYSGEEPVYGMAAWRGSTWTEFGRGGGLVAASHAWRNHRGDPCMLVCGWFQQLGGVNAWNFTAWAPVDSPPTWECQPVSMVGRIGQTVNLEATAWGNVTYQWRRNGQPLVDAGPVNGSSTSTLSVDLQDTSLEGIYDVVAQSSCGEALSDPATLIVLCQHDIAPSGAPDGEIDVDDLLAVIAAWGKQTDEPGTLPADFTLDQVVNLADLLQLLDAWGPCDS